MSLRDLIHTDVADVFLNTEDFAESLVYCPKGGTRRTITGVVDEDSGYQAVGPDYDNMEVLDVFVSRNATTGIDSPQLEDAISRVIDGTGDDAKWYSYKGIKNDTDENSWTLRFVRDVVHTHGGLRRQ